MKVLFAGACAALSLLAAAPAFAQARQPACPAGTVPSVVRVSAITPTGSMAGFQKAARDHIKWYRDHGYKDNDITIAPIIDTPDGGRTWAISSTKALSIHRNNPGVPASAQDDAWRAYVAEYRANSDIVTEILTCLPPK